MPSGMKIRYLYRMNRLVIGIMSTLILVNIKTHPFCLFRPSIHTKLPFFGYWKQIFSKRTEEGKLCKGCFSVYLRMPKKGNYVIFVPVSYGVLSIMVGELVLSTVSSSLITRLEFNNVLYCLQATLYSNINVAHGSLWIQPPLRTPAAAVCCYLTFLSELYNSAYLNRTIAKHNDFGQDLQEPPRVVTEVVISEECLENLTISWSRASSIQIVIVLPAFQVCTTKKGSKTKVWTEK